MKSELSIEIGTNRFLFLVFALAVSAIISSYSAEYLFHKSACYLCKLQRIPYFMMIPISLWGLSRKSRKLSLFFLIGTCLLSVSLGTYHFGIQQHIFNDQCQVSSVSNLAEFHKLLKSKSCAKIDWTILGIPAPLTNVIASLFLLVLASFRLKNERALL